METFSLLKYWRGGGAASNVRNATNPTIATVRTTTIATSVLRPSADSDGGVGDDDEGSFFDLEFSVPAADDGENATAGAGDSTSESGDEDNHGELNFTVQSSSPSSSDPSVSLSPSDELFFKGQLLPLEPSSVVVTTSSLDSDAKSSQLAVSLLKSATKLRVFMLGLKKLKSPQADPNDVVSSPKQNQNQNQNHNAFFINFKVEELPIISLFTRESSGSSKQGVKAPRAEEGTVITAEDQKKFSKETVQKYINKIKPLYVRVSKRYGEKMRFSGQISADGPAADVSGGDEAAGSGEAASASAAAAAAAVPAAAARVKLPARLRVVRKHLGKSRSASAVAAVASPPEVQQRRDDSLQQQQDGIQSAIAHCKRSLHAADAATKGSQSPLMRSKSDPTDDRSEKGNGDRCDLEPSVQTSVSNRTD